MTSVPSTLPHYPKSCLWCGSPLREQKSGQRRKFCKASCRQRAYEDRIHHNRDLRDRLRAQHADCYLCGDPLPWESAPDSVCLDHRIATVWGGVTNEINVKPVHVLCNLAKGARLIAVDSEDGAS